MKGNSVINGKYQVDKLYIEEWNSNFYSTGHTCPINLKKYIAFNKILDLIIFFTNLFSSCY